MIRRSALALVLAVPLLAAGCDGLFGPEELDGALRELDGGVDFLVREFHGPEGDEIGDPKLALYMITDHVYPCLGHAIEADVAIEGSLVTVEIAGVREPGICVDLDYAAEFRELIDIGEGEWTLRFVDGTRTTEFALSVQPAAIVVTGAADELAAPLHERFWRYPVNSFAVGCDRSGGDAAACEELFDSVATTAGVTPYAFGEEGGIPYPVSYSDATYEWDIRYWIGPDAATWQTAVGRAADVGGFHPGLRYFLLDWRNRIDGTWP